MTWSRRCRCLKISLASFPTRSLFPFSSHILVPTFPSAIFSRARFVSLARSLREKFRILGGLFSPRPRPFSPLSLILRDRNELIQLIGQKRKKKEAKATSINLYSTRLRYTSITLYILWRSRTKLCWRRVHWPIFISDRMAKQSREVDLKLIHHFKSQISCYRCLWKESFSFRTDWIFALFSSLQINFHLLGQELISNLNPRIPKSPARSLPKLRLR